jgi:hypothetical protein
MCGSAFYNIHPHHQKQHQCGEHQRLVKGALSKNKIGKCDISHKCNQVIADVIHLPTLISGLYLKNA